MNEPVDEGLNLKHFVHNSYNTNTVDLIPTLHPYKQTCAHTVHTLVFPPPNAPLVMIPSDRLCIMWRRGVSSFQDHQPANFIWLPPSPPRWGFAQFRPSQKQWEHYGCFPWPYVSNASQMDFTSGCQCNFVLLIGDVCAIEHRTVAYVASENMWPVKLEDLSSREFSSSHHKLRFDGWKQYLSWWSSLIKLHHKS